MSGKRHKPCAECPWRRKAAPGWLGPLSVEDWIGLAHGDELVACLLTIPPDSKEGDWERDESMVQCAGAAIYRKNVAKLPRHRDNIPADEADRETIFAGRDEFREHHAPS